MVIDKTICSLLIFLLLPLISAVTCTPSTIEKQYIQGTTPSNMQLECTNPLNSTIFVSKSGQYFNVAETLTIPSNSTKQFTISFSSSAPLGYYSTGQLSFSDSSNPINIFLNITSNQTQNDPPPQQQNSGIIVFPTAKVINVQQGQSKTQNIQLIVPQNYPRSIVIQSVSFNPDIDVVNFGDLDLGVLNPSQTLNIPIKVEAINVQTGTYNTQINILATDSQGQIILPSVNLQIIVSVGVNPTTNATFNTRPLCSISSSELNLNNTYSFICTNAVDNIEISPQYNEYIEGTRAEFSGGTYTYSFKAVKLGNTKFISTFNYKNSPIFSSFTQDLRITLTGVVTSGTSMKFALYQDDERKEDNNLMVGPVIIRVLDEKTDSIINGATVYYNGNVLSNATLNLEMNKQYELRASYPQGGYIDKTVNFTVMTRNIEYTINPTSNFDTSTMINITIKNPSNGSIFIDGNKFDNSFFSTLSEGIHQIEFIARGFQNTKTNITVNSIIQIIGGYNPLTFKKGNIQTFFLNKNATAWDVSYQKDLTSQKVVKTSGTGDKIIFTPDNTGTWIIESNGLTLGSYTIEGSKWIKTLTDNIWYTLGGILIIGFVGWLFIFRKKSSKDESSGVGFEMSPRGE